MSYGILTTFHGGRASVVGVWDREDARNMLLRRYQSRQLAQLYADAGDENGLLIGGVMWHQFGTDPLGIWFVWLEQELLITPTMEVCHDYPPA